VYPETQAEHEEPLYVEQLAIVVTHDPLEKLYPAPHVEHEELL